MLLLLLACKGEPNPEPWCDDGAVPEPAYIPPTWHGTIAPLFAQKCVRCHEAGGPGPMVLDDYGTAAANALAIRSSISARTMPPWLAAECCQPWFDDFSLTNDELADVLAWIDSGTPEGSPDDAGPSLDPIGGLTRIDIELAMDEPYTPNPTDGEDDQRCFVLDWPESNDTFITGLAPQPGNRSIVHHIVVSKAEPSDAAALEARDAEDDGPGFDCNGGLGDLPALAPIGGSLFGGDYPRGLGVPITGGSKIVLQMHYSTSGLETVDPDQTIIQFSIADEADDASAIVLANPGWLVGQGMRVPAGEEVGFWYEMRPDLFTGGRDVVLQGVSPHMHRYASKMRVLALREDGSTECLLEIPRWEFGWEMPFWYDTPVALGKNDKLYVECWIDNTESNQPDGVEARDIAWGEDDQDMCAAFLSFTVGD